MSNKTDKALERVIAQVEITTGISLAGIIGLSAYNPDGRGNRYKVEQISDENSDCIERHLSCNMTAGNMVDALDLTVSILRLVSELSDSTLLKQRKIIDAVLDAVKPDQADTVGVGPDGKMIYELQY